MKKQLLFLLLIWIPFSFINAQSQFENPGFEEWEPEDENAPTFEPVEWSSIKTSDLDWAATAAPLVMRRSDDAHTGNYSVHLVNIYNSLIDYVATGTMTNGRIHVDPLLNLEKSTSFTDVNNSQWHTAFTKRPDSVVGWYKGKPSVGDFPTVKVLLHTDSSSLPNPDSSNWVGLAYAELSPTEVSTWTRFSTPFDYYQEGNPEFMLSIITSGNGLSAVKDSEAWFDDVEFIYNGTDIPEKKAKELRTWYANGELNIQVEDREMRNAQINVVDITGRIVYSGAIENMYKNTFRLNLQDGIFIVTLTSGNSQLSKKIIVQ